MKSIRKIDHFSIGANDDIRSRIETEAPDSSVAEIMIKDALLVEAALVSDRIVVSLDETVRGHFSRACSRISELSDIIWVNPNATIESPIQWLEDGAKDEKFRRLVSVEHHFES